MAEDGRDEQEQDNSRMDQDTDNERENNPEVIQQGIAARPVPAPRQPSQK